MERDNLPIGNSPAPWLFRLLYDIRHMRSSNEDTRLLLSLQLQLNLINTDYSVLEKYQECGTGAEFSTSSSIRF